MKGLLKFVEIILMIVMVVWEAAEFLIVPAIFVIIGILNDFGYMYYIITIGGYLLLFLLFELICYFIFKAFDKKYTPVIERKLEKLFDKFAKTKENE